MLIQRGAERGKSIFPEGHCAAQVQLQGTNDIPVDRKDGHLSFEIITSLYFDMVDTLQLEEEMTPKKILYRKQSVMVSCQYFLK